MTLVFQWDTGNTRHIVNDYPERENTTGELESVFFDPNFLLFPTELTIRESNNTML